MILFVGETKELRHHRNFERFNKKLRYQATKHYDL